MTGETAASCHIAWPVIKTLRCGAAERTPSALGAGRRPRPDARGLRHRRRAAAEVPAGRAGDGGGRRRRRAVSGPSDVLERREIGRRARRVHARRGLGLRDPRAGLPRGGVLAGARSRRGGPPAADLLRACVRTPDRRDALKRPRAAFSFAVRRTGRAASRAGRGHRSDDLRCARRRA